MKFPLTCQKLSANPKNIASHLLTDAKSNRTHPRLLSISREGAGSLILALGPSDSLPNTQHLQLWGTCLLSEVLERGSFPSFHSLSVCGRQSQVTSACPKSTVASSCPFDSLSEMSPYCCEVPVSKRGSLWLKLSGDVGSGTVWKNRGWPRISTEETSRIHFFRLPQAKQTCTVGRGVPEHWFSECSVKKLTWHVIQAG